MSCIAAWLWRGAASRATRREPGRWSSEREETEMQLRHNMLVVVADGRKALFLRNQGDGVNP
ncbi:MAG: host attachment protein, partial [Sphingomonas sp.]